MKQNGKSFALEANAEDIDTSYGKVTLGLQVRGTEGAEVRVVLTATVESGRGDQRRVKSGSELFSHLPSCALALLWAQEPSTKASIVHGLKLKSAEDTEKIETALTTMAESVHEQHREFIKANFHEHPDRDKAWHSQTVTPAETVSLS